MLFNNTNSTELVGKSTVFRGHSQTVTFSNHFTRLRVDRKRLDPFYLARWLTRQQQLGVFEGLCTRWVGQSAVRSEKLLGMKIPLPSLPKQRRIADILDKADAIRRKRWEVLDLAIEFRRSTFLDLFGDPAVHKSQWPVVDFSRTWSGGLRNGISPSSRGSHQGKVLVLSAITGPAFDHNAVKNGTFEANFDSDQLVKADEFLICRGNANLRLVGAGRFPLRSLDDTVFPDTMIATRLNREVIEPAYLEEIWAMPHVRSQLERGARTTNGTHKINQQVLAGITFPLPPLPIQKRYTSIVAGVIKLVNRYKNSPVEELFQSLVQRAFRGEL